MPELPEVETVRRTLNNYLKDKTIKEAFIYYPNIVLNEPDFFINEIKNKKIVNILRRGKWLIFDLEKYYLISHLRMEGKYHIKNNDDDLHKHTHVVFNIDNDFKVFYDDTRKFGRMKLIFKENLENEINVGLEPFDSLLDINYLKTKFSKIKLPIKSVLLDQTIIAGIGNIYANEILFAASISPFKKACELNDNELERIISNTRKILSKAIEMHGTTIKTYEAVGQHGGFQEQLCVHMKEGSKCLNCDNLIMKTAINGRSTYYCLNCQK